MGIRYYAYAFDGDQTAAVMADPWAYLSSDPLADAWGFEPHACLATPTFQQRLPERDLLYLDKAWHELQLLTGPGSVGGSERPSFRMFEGNVALLDAYTWEPWIPGARSGRAGADLRGPEGTLGGGRCGSLAPTCPWPTWGRVVGAPLPPRGIVVRRGPGARWARPGLSHRLTATRRTVVGLLRAHAGSVTSHLGARSRSPRARAPRRGRRRPAVAGEVRERDLRQDGDPVLRASTSCYSSVGGLPSWTPRSRERLPRRCCRAAAARSSVVLTSRGAGGSVRCVVVGAGPVGTTAALLLARRGDAVTLVDRDPGPRADGGWERRGVMQFHLPHAFRGPSRELLAERLPDVFAALLDAGVVDRGDALAARRSTLERVLWEAASREPGITRLTGHAEQVVVEGDRAVGVVVEGRTAGADLVVDASGRSGRIAEPHRPPGVTHDCGMAYAARLYRLRAGAEAGPTTGGVGLVHAQPGFYCLLFTHDAGTFTVLFVRASADRALAGLRDPVAFEAAARLLPDVATWLDPARSEPIDRVRAGAGLTNSYRPQPRGVLGLLATGDAVCTTNPMGARGVSLGLESAGALVDVVADSTVAEADRPRLLDAWAEVRVRPWFADHVATDAVLVARLGGREDDPEGFVPWDVVLAAAAERPAMMAALGPFLAMAAPPSTLDPLREEVRAMLRTGWRPPRPPGPTREDLAAVIGASA